MRDKNGEDKMKFMKELPGLIRFADRAGITNRKAARSIGMKSRMEFLEASVQDVQEKQKYQQHLIDSWFDGEMKSRLPGWAYKRVVEGKLWILRLLGYKLVIEHGMVDGFRCTACMVFRFGRLKKGERMVWRFYGGIHAGIN